MIGTKRNLFILVLGYLLALIFFTSVSPEGLPLIYILVPFFIVFILLYATVNMILATFFDISRYQKRLISLVLSIMPVLLLIIQSITQLTIRDIILCLAITVIIIWYSSRAQVT